jgi:hypothetical protein
MNAKRSKMFLNAMRFLMVFALLIGCFAQAAPAFAAGGDETDPTPIVVTDPGDTETENGDKNGGSDVTVETTEVVTQTLPVEVVTPTPEPRPADEVVVVDIITSTETITNSKVIEGPNAPACTVAIELGCVGGTHLGYRVTGHAGGDPNASLTGSVSGDAQASIDETVGPDFFDTGWISILEVVSGTYSLSGNVSLDGIFGHREDSSSWTGTCGAPPPPEVPTCSLNATVLDESTRLVEASVSYDNGDPSAWHQLDWDDGGVPYGWQGESGTETQQHNYADYKEVSIYLYLQKKLAL